MLFSIDIADKDTERVAKAICSRQGYQAVIEDADGNQIPNLEDPITFARKWVIKQIEDEVMMYERQVAEAAVKISTITIT